jgi:nitrite reductase (NADH) small subunit
MLPSRPQEYVLGYEDRVLRCPWHGWEFDLETGESLFDPERWRVRVYPVRVEDGEILVEI